MLRLATVVLFAVVGHSINAQSQFAGTYTGTVSTRINVPSMSPIESSVGFYSAVVTANGTLTLNGTITGKVSSTGAVTFNAESTPVFGLTKGKISGNKLSTEFADGKLLGNGTTRYRLNPSTGFVASQPAATAKPTITTQPKASSVNEGAALSLSVTASGTSLKYQWIKDGKNISGATAATYSVAKAAVANAGKYSVVVSNTGGSVTSSVVTVTVTLAKPTIKTQPKAATVNEGAALSLSITASGTSLKYQWLKDGKNISGATAATYSVAKTAVANAGKYSVVVSNTGGSVTSSVVTVTVTLTKPTIKTQPKAASVTEGAALSLSVTASGTSLKYQWLKDGKNISGATTATYSVAKAATSHAGKYSVVVSNTGGSVTSSVVTVTVTLAKPVITTQPKAASVNEDAALSLSVTASGTSLKYQWLKDGKNISGATAATYSVAKAATSHAGKYSVVVSNAGGSVTSSVVTVTVKAKPAPVITFAGPGNRIFTTAPITLTATVTSGPAVGFAIVSGPATVSGSTLTLTGLGSVTIRASQTGNPAYVDRTITISKSAEWIYLSKGRLFIQSDASTVKVAPSASLPYSFWAEVDAGSGSAVRSTSAKLSPAPRITLPASSKFKTTTGKTPALGLGTDSDDGWNFGYTGKEYFDNWGSATKAELDSFFPAGVYTFVVQSKSIPLTLPADAYPAAPVVTLSGGSWSGGVYRIRSDKALTIGTGTYAAYGTQANNALWLFLADQATEDAVFDYSQSAKTIGYQGLPVSATKSYTRTIPAKTLKAGRYEVEAGFIAMTTQGTSMPGCTHIVSYETATRLFIEVTNP